MTEVRLTKSVARQRIRDIAANSGNVIIGAHAKERMVERGIFRPDIDRILRTGDVSDEPEPAELGEWKCKVTRAIRGGRTAGVVTLILRGGKRLFVKTVEWEDGK